MSDEIPLIATLGLLGCVFGLALCSSPMAGGDVSLGYPHEVTGTVAKDPTTRYVRTDSGGQEKVALTLQVESKTFPRTIQPAVVGGSIVVECVSTRCSQIQAGETHTLACRGEGRLLEPNVVVCKHKRQEG